MIRHLVLFCFLTCGQGINLDEAVGPVIYLNMIYRHGDRTPVRESLKIFPNDINLNRDNFPEGWDQLTVLGKRQLYNLGKWVGTRYIHLLPDGRYQPETICAKSTDTDRTLNSAMLNLAGIFPPGSKQEFVDQLNWQPIPVRYNPRNQDKLLVMDVPCKAYSEIVNEFIMSDAAKQIKNKFQDLNNMVGIKSGNISLDMYYLALLYDVLFIEDARNLPIDKQFVDVYPDKLREACDFALSLPTFTDPMKRLFSGPVLKEIIENMEKSSKGLNTDTCVNITSYSAHDITIVNLMNTIGVHNYKRPPYASIFMVELRKKHNQYFVTTLFKNTTENSDPYYLPIPGCEEPCSFDTFKTLMKKYVPENWCAECNM